MARTKASLRATGRARALLVRLTDDDAAALDELAASEGRRLGRVVGLAERVRLLIREARARK